MSLIIYFAFFSFLSFGLVGGSCVQAALLGEFTIKDEVELGQKFNAMIRANFELIEDPELAGYVQESVARLVKSMPPQPFPIEASLIRDNAMNAFASAGGYVYVFTGMVLNVENESELTGVLAHELAHVSQRHIASHMERAKLVNLGTMLGVLAGAFIGSKNAGEAIVIGSLAAGQTANLKYSREDEREADQVGMNYLVRSGYCPQGLPRSFELIRRKKLFGGNSIPAYLSTHPDVEERIEYLKNRVDRLPAEARSRTDNNGRLYRVQTLLRAKYTDPVDAAAYFEQAKSQLGCLAYLGLAIAQERNNRIRLAEEAYNQALACGKSDPLVQREAGRFYFGQGRFNESSRLLQEAVLRSPQDVEALFYYARLLSAQGQNAQAVSYMERILRQLPENAEVHQYLGRILGEVGNLFRGHIHLCYAAIYRNDSKKAALYLKQAKDIAKTEDDKVILEKIEAAYKDRSQFWAKAS